MTFDEARAIAVQVSDIYAENCGIERDEVWALLKLQEELGEATAAWLSLTGRGRSRGLDPAALRVAFEEELADVLAHLLLFADQEGVDLPGALRRKWGRYLPDAGGRAGPG